jgi:LppP/LprE lipoprotein
MRSTMKFVSAMLIAIVTCSCAARPQSSVRQDSQPASPVWSLSPESTSASTPEGAQASFNYAAVASIIAKQHLSIEDGPAISGSPGPLRAFVVICTGTVDGDCGTVDFFYNQYYVGGLQPAHLSSLTIRPYQSRIVYQNGRIVTIDFPLTTPQDQLCCATGGTFRATYRWNGESVIATGSREAAAPRIAAKPNLTPEP